MIDLGILSEEDMDSVCFLIPYEEIKKYFEKYPNEFAKIRPGFRPKSIKFDDAHKILASNKNRDFISSFIRKVVNRWLLEIQKSYQRYLDGGNSPNTAIIRTLAQSYFSSNVNLYFKLEDKGYTESEINIISELVKFYRDVSEENDEIKHTSEIMKSQKDALEKQNNDKKQMIEELKSKKRELLHELQLLRSNREKYNQMEIEIEHCQQILDKKTCELDVLKKKEEELFAENNDLRNENASLQEIISMKKAEEEEWKTTFHNREFSLMCPTDISEFCEGLVYNFENIGLQESIPGVKLLINQLARTLFCGVPVLLNSKSGINLARCVANSLIGTQNISVLQYREEITTKDICRFLNESTRVVVLDNFIGNYNEMQLIPFLKNFGDKIIFITATCDRSLMYVSEEMFSICNYINVSCFGQNFVRKLSEDPVIIEESVFELKPVANERNRKVLEKILDELCLRSFKLACRLRTFKNEEDIASELAFNVIPYCVYVEHQNPLMLSDTLQKYIGRCAHKEFLMGRAYE